MIRLDNITFTYQYDDYATVRNLNLVLEDGINTVLCPKQYGKTTICKLIMGLVTPQQGEVIVDRQKGILYLADTPAFNNKSVRYNVAYPLKLRKQSNSFINAKVQEVSEQLGITQLLDAKFGKLTYMQQRKVIVARGLTTSHEVVLVDGWCDDVPNENETCNVNELVQVLANHAKCIVVFTSNESNVVGKLTRLGDE